MAAPPYQEALDRAGYQHKLEYIEADANACERRRRKRKKDTIYPLKYNWGNQNRPRIIENC